MIVLKVVGFILVMVLRYQVRQYCLESFLSAKLKLDRRLVFGCT